VSQAQNNSQDLNRSRESTTTIPSEHTHFLRQLLSSERQIVQKFTFNFIKQFSTETNISFNELNFRKCLTFKLKSPVTEANPISLLESLGSFSSGPWTTCGPPTSPAEKNIDAENFFILL
jgi:hypothetical protein